MAFERPTLLEIVTRSQADFISRLDRVGAVLRRSMINILARVLAGAVHMLYGRIEYLAEQLFPDKSEAAFLERYAAIYGILRQPADFADGEVVVTSDEEADILEGELLRRSDGVEYVVTASTTITGSGNVPVRAVLAAASGNADEGTALSFESPIPRVNSVALVAAGGLTGGADPETDTALRNQLLARIQDPPQGGAANDYEQWALAVAGVTRVWVYPNQLGPGTVVIFFARDNDVSPIPSGGEVTEVQDYIDERRPVTADVTVAAPTAKTWNFTITVTPNTPEVKASVQAELGDLFATVPEPGVTLPISRVRTAIGNATGLTDYILTSPSSNLTHAAGELAVLGTFTWGP